MKLKRLLVSALATAMCFSAFSVFTSAAALGTINTTISFSEVALDVDTEYQASKAQIVRALQLTQDEADLIPDGSTYPVDVTGTATYSNGIINLDGTAEATYLGDTHTLVRDVDYTVTSVDMAIVINGTSYPATFDAETGVISCDYTISSTQTSITATISTFTVEAVSEAGQVATFDYSASATDAECHVTIGDELDFTVARPGILTVDGEVSATVGEETVPATITFADNGAFTVTYEVSVTPIDPQGTVEDFINRLYQEAFGRDADAAGLTYWVNRINNGMTGGDVARYFLTSPEYVAQGETDREFVDTLYYVFFDRAGDTAGINYWMDKLDAGADHGVIISNFINSVEWANVCLSYGIESGSTMDPSIVINPNDAVMSFVQRLYTYCLNRDNDVAGMKYWSMRLANRKITGSYAARFFFNSDEFQSVTMTNSEYVTRLYRTIMDRTPDVDGMNFYLTRLENGTMTRAQVLEAFLGSVEWGRICASYGIAK